MTDIFISYARSTATQAQVAAEALRALGYGVWLDDELPAHRAYGDVIDEHLSAAMAVLVIWSSEAVKSDWVRSEANRAREAHKLVQLTIDNAPLPMPFDQIHCVDMRGWNGDTNTSGWDTIVRSIAELLGTSAPTTQHVRTSAPIVQSTEPLLAVLAFDNLFGDADMAYFSDGVSEEIQQTLARGSELKVIGRASSFQFRGASKAASNVAAQLKATHILDGSIRRSGNKVRIATQLIECATQTTVWSDRFDRDLSDVFELQDEIARAVASALQVTFARATKLEPIDPEAYELFLRARKLGFDNANPETAALLEQAVTKAPMFAPAWAELARERAFRLRYVVSDQPYPPRRAAVIVAAETSLRLDARLGPAYAALSMLEPLGAYRAQEAVLQRGLSISSSDPALLYAMSIFNATVGRARDALAHAKQAYQLDPLYPYAANWYAVMTGAVGESEASQHLFDGFRARWPDERMFTTNPAISAANYGDRGRFEALEQFARGAGFFSDGNDRYGLQWRYGRASLDDDPDFTTTFRELLNHTLANTTTAPPDLLVAAFGLGLKDEAFAAIEQASFAHMFGDDVPPFMTGGVSPGIIFDPPRAELRHDTRFVGLCAKLGLCDYWVETNRWPDCADAVAPHYDFKAEARRLVADRLSKVSSRTAPERDR